MSTRPSASCVTTTTKQSRPKELRFYQETTRDVDYPLHIYAMDTDKRRVYAYIQAGTNRHLVFEKPLDFDPRTRTFKDIGVV